MSEQKIAFLVKDDGTIEMMTDGFVGEGCLEEANKVLAKLKELGVETETTSITHTQEFYATEQERIKSQT